MPPRLREPEPRADLGHSHQRHRQQPGGLVGQPGVVVDDVGDHRGALGGDPVDVLAHGGLVGQVGLEDEPERAGVAGDVLEERLHRGRDALLVVVRGLQRVAAVVDDRVARGVEQREVEVELAGEVLVEHRLGDAGALGDVVHRGGVVALRDEHLERGLQQLGPALAARHPAAARARCRRVVPASAHFDSCHHLAAPGHEIAQPTAYDERRPATEAPLAVVCVRRVVLRAAGLVTVDGEEAAVLAGDRRRDAGPGHLDRVLRVRGVQ